MGEEEHEGGVADKAAEPASAPSARGRAPRFELMPETFPRLAHDLDGDGFRRTGAALLVAGIVLGAWTAWFLLARVSLFVTSESARIEAVQAAHSVDARVAGSVVATHMKLDRKVEAGDLLVELDAHAQRLQLEEERAVERALAQQLVEIAAEIASQQRAIEQTESARGIGLAEARAQERASATAAQFAEVELERSSGLRRQQLISEAELVRQQAQEVERRAEASGRRLAVGRLTSERHAVVAGMRARLAELNRDAEELRGKRAASSLAIGRLERAVEDRLIRAPIAGRIADVADVRPGEVVGIRESLGTIVPRGPLEVVALFAPGGTVGRVQTGQTARLRVDGFPWAQYGTIAAEVTAVGLEPRNGRIRVELRLVTGSLRIPLQHGLTGAVDVLVERVSPAVLVLRSATGYFVSRPPASGGGARP